MREDVCQKMLEIIRSWDSSRLRIMEVCGTHTHEIFRLGIRQLLPDSIELISGPGCPVCVTPVDFIDEAVCLALEHQAVVCTFGDLIRVPGTKASLADARSRGGQIRMVYTPADAVEYAAKHPEKQVVFLAVGFETTTPGICLALRDAMERELSNFTLLTANKTMPGAYRLLKDSVDVYLYPGHVNAITGTSLCEALTEEGISGVVAGFTAPELLTALAAAVKKSKEGRPFFVNAYPRVVTREGSQAARKLVEEFMEPCDAEWRGLGVIAGSGRRLRNEFAYYDARVRFQLPPMHGHSNPACRCGEVLQGKCQPTECPCFGRGCTPAHPVGACMVSGEGACAAYYQYGGNLR